MIELNGPQFFTFRKPSDWRRGTTFHLEFRDRGLTIRREQVYRHVRQVQLTYPQLAGDIQDTAMSRDGRMLLLDRHGVVWRADLISNHAESVGRAAEELPEKGMAMAAAQESVVLLAPGPRSALYLLTADRGQLRWTVEDWYGDPIRGLAVAVDREDIIWVLAEDEHSDQLLLLSFDIAGIPQNRFSIPALLPPIPTADQTEEREMEQAGEEGGRFQLTAGSEGELWLLDRKAQRIALIRTDASAASWLNHPLDERMETVLALNSRDPGQVWCLIRALEGSAPHALVRIGSDGAVLERGFTGSARGDRLFGDRNRLYIWNSGEKSLHMVHPVAETAVWKPFGRRMGVWISDALDSGMPDTEWHKIVVRARQEHDAQFIVRYFSSNHPEAVLPAFGRVMVDEFVRDPKVEPEVKIQALSGLWSAPVKDPEDALFIGAKGRYLWIMLELIGSEQHAPVLESMEAHFPRQSMLDYLPSIYQRHEPTRDFLTRYLSLYQTMLDETDRNISRMTRSLDPGGSSGSSLRWLLGWLGLRAEHFWTEEQLRKLLRIAPELQQLRGTKTAIEKLVEIYTGEKPIILEYDQVKPLKENEELGEVAERLYAADPHSFNVLVKAEHADTEMKRVTLHHLIDSFKPAFASFKLIILQPWVYMDLHSYLGMNTVLSEPTLLTLDGRSSMPHHTITIDLGHESRIDQHTRLGLDSRLE